MLSRQSNFIQKPPRQYKRRMPPWSPYYINRCPRKWWELSQEKEKKKEERDTAITSSSISRRAQNISVLLVNMPHEPWHIKVICMSFLSILKQAKQWFPGKVTNPSPPLLQFTELGTETSVPLYRIWCTEHHAYALGQHQAVLYLSWWGCRSIAPCKISFTQIKQIY